MKVVTLDSIVSTIRAKRGNKEFLSKFIEECEIVDAIKIPEGATNGEVLMSVFHEIQHYSDGKICASWWNAPYKREVSE